jgi:hypothetical protein
MTRVRTAAASSRGREGKSLTESYRSYTELIRAQEHICGYCYTQLYDLYQELNGLLRLDHEPKVRVEDVRSINEGRPPETIKSISRFIPG